MGSSPSGNCWIAGKETGFGGEEEAMVDGGGGGGGGGGERRDRINAHKMLTISLRFTITITQGNVISLIVFTFTKID